MSKRVLSLLVALLLCIASLYTLLCNIYSIDSKWGNIAPWFGTPEEVQDLTEVDMTQYFTITVTEQQRNQWLSRLQEARAQMALSDDGFELTSPVELAGGLTVLQLALSKEQIHEGDNRYCFSVETAGYIDDASTIPPVLPAMHPELIQPAWCEVIVSLVTLLLPLLISTLLLFLIAPNCGTWHGLKFLFIGLILSQLILFVEGVMIMRGVFGPYFIDNGAMMMICFILLNIIMAIIWLVLGCFFLLLRAATRRLRRKSQIED